MTRSIKEIKSDIAWQLRELIGIDRFELWFSSDDSFQLSNDTVVVRAMDDFALSFVRQQFGSSIRQAVDAVIGSQASIRFESISESISSECQQNLFSDAQLAPSRIENNGRNNRKRSARKRQVNTLPGNANHPAQAELKLDPPPHPSPKNRFQNSTLADFQFGPANKILKTAVKELLEFPGKFNPLVLFGPVGCGKSHLLQAIACHTRRQRSYRCCLYLTAEQFTTQFVEALGTRSLTSFRSKYRSLDLFAIDDIQFLSGKRATLIEFQNTVEALLRTGRQIVVASDRPIYELGFLGNELITRLSCGLACPIDYPDLDGRIAIVRRLAKQRDLKLNPSVERFIAERISRDVRLLSGAINGLRAASFLSPDAIDLNSAEDILRDMIQSQHSVVSMSKIEEIVCNVCGVEPSELKSSKRIKRISTARMLAMWLSRKYTSAALSEIGSYYGGRTHSTVIAAEKKINLLLEQQQEIELQNQRCDIDSAVGRIEYGLRSG